MKYADWAFLDLETTGINPQVDKIIEVAAVVLTRQGEREIFNRLVNPGIPIPAHITTLTGIADEMVAGAVSFDELKPALLQLLKDKVIVAHNAGFDLSFLEAALGAKLPNRCIDTYELSRLLYPNMTSYGLRPLNRVLSLQGRPAHRALPDVETLEELFLHLVEKARNLPLAVIQDLDIFLQSETGLSFLIREILQEKIKHYDFTREFMPGGEEEENQQEEERIRQPEVEWDLAALEAMLLPGGKIARGLRVYQKRTEQVKMLKAVGKALFQERHLLVEAGTGVGKSLAYLVPAIAWAVSRGEKVVVATHTIALQEQLYRGEIEFLGENLGFAFKAAVLKGRANYICLYKWNLARKNKTALSWAEKVMMARLYLWLKQYRSGDRDTINLREWEAELYAQVASTSESCLGAACPFIKDCFYQKARQRAQAADIIIVNHSLLLADLKLGDTILPSYQYLIVDEAHHLEEEGTRQFSEVFSLRDFSRNIAQIQNKRDLVKKSGLLHYWKQQLSAAGEKETGINSKKEAAQGILDLLREAEAALSRINQASDEITRYFVENRPGEIVRVHGHTKNAQWWQDLSLHFDNLLLPISDFLLCFNNIYNRLVMEMDYAETEGPLKELKYVLGLLKADYELARSFFAAEQEQEKVYWLETDVAKKDLRLHITPLKTGKYFHDLLFTVKTSVILTSATLSVEDSFSFLMEQLGIPEELADTLQIPSPFLYDEQALLLVDSSLPNPSMTSEDEYNQAIKEALLQLIKVTKGGTLVLFTAHKQLRLMFELLSEPLRRAGLELYADGVNGRRNNLVLELKNNPQAVVFGANTFWEGIDLPGPSLTSLIMVKLPFSPPHLPLVEARMEELQKEGKNGFYHYSLPSAVLRFRQGYGRLIRTMNDCGVVVVLDNRVINKSYGQMFIHSLPHHKYEAGDTRYITEKIENWFRELKIHHG